MGLMEYNQPDNSYDGDILERKPPGRLSAECPLLLLCFLLLTAVFLLYLAWSDYYVKGTPHSIQYGVTVSWEKSHSSLASSLADHNQDDFYRAMTLSWTSDLKIQVVRAVKDSQGKDLGCSASCSNERCKYRNKIRSHPILLDVRLVRMENKNKEVSCIIHP